MTREEAIKILDPETRLEYLVEVEYKAGFRGAGAVADAMKEALDMATAALREQGGSFQNGNDQLGAYGMTMYVSKIVTKL